MCYCIVLISSLLFSQQHTTLHTTAGLLLKLSRVGPGPGRDTAGSGVGGPVGGTLSSGLKKISQFPRAVIGDTALCRVLSFRWDVKWVTCLSEVIKDPMALIVRIGVFVLAKSPNNPHFAIGSFIPLLSPVTIPQVDAATYLEK